MRRTTVSEFPGYRLALLLASTGFLPVCIAGAPPYAMEEPSRFQAYVDFGIDHDSNLFRFSGDDEARSVLGSDDRDDFILRYGAGIAIDLPISLQRVQLDLSAMRRGYDRNDFLDHTQADARGVWHWTFGRLWRGNVRAIYRRDLAPFEDFDDFEAPAKDIRTLYDAGFEALRALAPRWDLGLSYSRREISHDYIEHEALDRDSDLVALELFRRAAGSNSYLSLRTQARMVSYPNRESVAATLVDNSHTEYELSANARWEATERSRLDGRLGYARVRHDDFSERDFSGLIWNLRYLYRLTPRFDVEASAWRDIDPRSNTSASFLTTEGLMLRSVWRYREKVEIAGALAREERVFEGDPRAAVTALPVREDTVESLEISASYAQTTFLSWQAALRIEAADSNRAERDYRYRIVSASARLTF